MFLKLKSKLKLILAGMAITVILSALSPFIIRTNWGPISKEAAQGVFLALDFFVAVYLWRQFNNLRVIINKEELEDENISKLKKEVDRIIKPKV